MVNLEDLFPGLKGSGYQTTRPTDKNYNCIAWAASDTGKWWWPSAGGKEFWPAGVPRAETLAAFRQAFACLGYEDCGGEQQEEGFEKIALFAGADGFPLHAARQLASGRWSSKLGEREDIEHGLRDLEGTEYGVVVQIMKRPLVVANAQKAEGTEHPD